MVRALSDDGEPLIASIATNCKLASHEHVLQRTQGWDIVCTRRHQPPMTVPYADQLRSDPPSLTKPIRPEHIINLRFIHTASTASQGGVNPQCRIHEGLPQVLVMRRALRKVNKHRQSDPIYGLPDMTPVSSQAVQPAVRATVLQ